MNIPLVSICCLTYNHESFIRECLEGILMQQTNFSFEILIHDDASTDKTAEIIKEYELRHPDKVFPIYQTENMYSKGYKAIDVTFNYLRAKGRYIAVCEGDDYWTDSMKLQKQVDFLESHQEYSVCFHRCKHYYEDTGKFEADRCAFLFTHKTLLGVDVTTEMYFKQWITQALTMVFRKDRLDMTLAYRYRNYRDMCEIYHLMQLGKAYLFAFEGGVYRHHSGGIHGTQSLKFQCEMGIAVAKELYLKNKPDSYVKDNYLRNLQWGINTFTKNRYDILKLLFYIFEHLYYSKSIKYWLKNLLQIRKGH